MKNLRPILTSALLLTAASPLFALQKGGQPGDQPGQPGQQKPQELLNVSYDPTRELFEELNPKFIAQYQKQNHRPLSIKQSHGGSGAQAQAVIDGLKADVVTLALAPDIDKLADKGLVKADWQKAFPFNSAPYTSTIVFVVREGNPKAVQDWSDLTKEDIGIVTPNPKTSGGARWGYLAAWGYALQAHQQDGNAAQEFVTRVFDHVVALDSGARGATVSFAEKQKGDVLITWENEAHQILKTYKDQKFEIVLPSVSILAEPVVAVVDKNVDEKHSRKAATAYLNYLYSKDAQEVIAQNFYRPRDEEVAKRYEDVLKPIPLFTLENTFGSWKDAQAKHFADGGILDQILTQSGQH